MEITKGTVIWFEDADTGEDVRGVVESVDGDAVLVFFGVMGGWDTVSVGDIELCDVPAHEDNNWTGTVVYGGKVY